MLTQATVILIAHYISVAGGLGTYAALLFVGAVSMVRVQGLWPGWGDARRPHGSALLLIIIILSFQACAGLALTGSVTFVALFGLACGYYTSVYAAVAMDFGDEHRINILLVFRIFRVEKAGVITGAVQQRLVRQNDLVQPSPTLVRGAPVLLSATSSLRRSGNVLCHA